jgi:hypothetical protein
MGHEIINDPATIQERQESKDGFATVDIPLLKTLRVLKTEKGQLQVNKKLAPTTKDIQDFLQWTTGNRKPPLPPIARRILCLKRAIIKNSVSYAQTGNLQRTGENKQLEEIDALLRADGVKNLDTVEKCSSENNTFVGGVPVNTAPIVEATPMAAPTCGTTINCDNAAVVALLQDVKTAVDELKDKEPGPAGNSEELTKVIGMKNQYINKLLDILKDNKINAPPAPNGLNANMANGIANGNMKMNGVANGNEQKTNGIANGNEEKTNGNGSTTNEKKENGNGSTANEKKENGNGSTANEKKENGNGSTANEKKENGNGSTANEKKENGNGSTANEKKENDAAVTANDKKENGNGSAANEKKENGAVNEKKENGSAANEKKTNGAVNEKKTNGAVNEKKENATADEKKENATANMKTEELAVNTTNITKRLVLKNNNTYEPTLPSYKFDPNNNRTSSPPESVRRKTKKNKKSNTSNNSNRERLDPESVRSSPMGRVASAVKLIENTETNTADNNASVSSTASANRSIRSSHSLRSAFGPQPVQKTKKNKGNKQKSKRSTRKA